MFEARLDRRSGYVKLLVAGRAGEVFGAAFSWSIDDRPFRPCAINPGAAGDNDALLAATFWTWNQAIDFGRVKFPGKARAVYWNLFLNDLHDHRGPVIIRADILRAGGIEQSEITIDLQPTRAIYLRDWTRWVQPDSGWHVDAGRLTLAPGGNPTPLRVPVPRAGRYDIHIGLRGGGLAAMLSFGGDSPRCPFIVSPKHPELVDKSSKEIPWQSADLAADSHIEIAPVPQAVRDPKIQSFGAIAYIKLIPQARKPPTAKPVADCTLALYFEPYSWAYFFGLTTPRHVRDAMRLYKDMGATEVHNQIIRFGSRALHHSRAAERFNAGAFMADDGTFSDAPTDMVKSLDVLRETIDACRDLGLTHYTNAGLTNCYPGTAFEEKISREHPEWRTGNVLRFSHPEVRTHVASVMAEFVEWGTDGLSIDCMRYPDHHTEEELLLLFREIRAVVDAKAAGRAIPLTVRIPASDTVYYRAFHTLARERIIQGVVPSTVWPREPYVSVKPYLPWKEFGCRVLGIVDGWKTWVGTFCDHYQLELLLDPKDIRADMTRHVKEGADGIFVYQADGHCADHSSGAQPVKSSTMSLPKLNSVEPTHVEGAPPITPDRLLRSA